VAIADQAAGHRLGWLNPTLYQRAGLGTPASGIVDVRSGNNTETFCSSPDQDDCGTPAEVDTTVPGYAGGPGYDMASGLGTVDATYFVNSLSKPAATSLGVSCAPAPAGVGRPTTCTVKVTGTTAPSGTVSFASNSNGGFSPASCTLSAVDGASSSCAVTYTPGAIQTGTHRVYASYSGDPFNAATHGSTDVTVGRGPSTTTVSCSPGTVAAGARTTCTATVSGGLRSAAPSGQVSFASNSSGAFDSTVCHLTQIAPGAGTSSCSVTYRPTAVQAGSHKIYASYPGDANYTASQGTTAVSVHA
jgi:hypothetical protein